MMLEFCLLIFISLNKNNEEISNNNGGNVFYKIHLCTKNAGKEYTCYYKIGIFKKYPAAIAVKWDKEGEKYEANFYLDKADHSVLMDARANIIETEIEIKLSQLPNGILDHVKKYYAGKKVQETAKITDAKGIITYEVEINGPDLIFDSNGKFIKELKV